MLIGNLKLKRESVKSSKRLTSLKKNRKIILGKVTKAIYEVYDLTGVKIDNLFFVSEYLKDHPVKDGLGMLDVNRNAEYCFCVFYEGSAHRFFWTEFNTALRENYKKHSWLGYFTDFY